MSNPRERITHGAGEVPPFEAIPIRYPRPRKSAHTAAVLLCWGLLAVLLGAGAGVLAFVRLGWLTEECVYLSAAVALLVDGVVFPWVVWRYWRPVGARVGARPFPPETQPHPEPIPATGGDPPIDRDPRIHPGQPAAHGVPLQDRRADPPDVPITNQLRLLIAWHRERNRKRADALGGGLLGLFSGATCGVGLGFLSGGAAQTFLHWSPGDSEALGWFVGAVAGVPLALLGVWVVSRPFTRGMKALDPHIHAATQHLVDNYPDRVGKWGGVDALHYPDVLAEFLAIEELRDKSR
jgi:hypothetical protein